MIRRAVALSLLAHAVLLGAIAWRWRARPEEPTLRISAPLGDVFAQPKSEPKPRAVKANGLGAEVAESAPAAPGTASGEAQPIGEIRPVYPAMSRKLGEEGEATFLLKIAADGHVQEATLERSTGHPRLDDAARAALVGARFVSDGQTAAKRFRVEFRLR